MKSIIRLYLLVFFAWPVTLFAQEPFLATCKTGPFTFFIQKDARLGALYCVSNSVTYKTDTMLIAGVRDDSIKCFCNDTLVVFHVIHDTSIEKFQFTAGKWQYISSTWLPEEFPLVGLLIDGEIYKRYRHKLVAVDKVVSSLTLLRANEGNLIPLEKYSIEYKIIPGSTKPEVVKKIREKL